MVTQYNNTKYDKIHLQINFFLNSNRAINVQILVEMTVFLRTNLASHKIVFHDKVLHLLRLKISRE